MTAVTTASADRAAHRFSYAALTPEAETIVRSAADAIRSVTARSVPEIGRHLLTAKEALPHGAFTAWAEAELGITQRSAQNYMKATAWLEGKPETVSLLPPTIIYALARPDTPPDLVDDVVTMGEAGEIDLRVVRERLVQATTEQVELRIAQRRNPKLTPQELRARKEKQRQKAGREYARDEANRQREDAERALRLLPLAQRVAALGAETVEALFAAVGQYQDKLTLIEIVREMLADAAAARGGA